MVVICTFENAWQKCSCTTACRVFTFHHLWPFWETVNLIILSLHWTCKIYMQPWIRFAYLWPKGKFHWWCFCCYCTTSAGFLHFLLFLCPYLTKIHSFSLKLSSSLYRDDWHGSHLIFFFSTPGITTHPKFYHRWKKIFSPSIFLNCWSIICFFFSW